MAEQDDTVLNLARSVSDRLAGGSLTPAFAKLYSQHTRLDAGQPGLARWQPDEATNRLDDAVRLIDAALLRRSAGDENWSDGMLRAAELLEWLSHPTLNADGVPITLLAAAAYQLAGYPARAAGLITADEEGAPTSAAGPLRSLLRGDFPALYRSLTARWATLSRRPSASSAIRWAEEALSAAQVRRLVEDETTSALGILAAAMRWGDETRVSQAIAKLHATAKLMLAGRDRYSWLLAKLVAETAQTLIDTALRGSLRWLPSQLDATGPVAVERYLRQAYLSCKTQAWPSQQRGIDRLAEGGSFVLCTPTGSGKTSVAEIAILQHLYSASEARRVNDVAPLVMYLVPKRALAAEVEAKMLRTIGPLGDSRTVITGLYGGIDWGPTDAWLTATDRTVLICTYEKAEALIRFLGPLFLDRLSLVILDEAHAVQFDDKLDDLRNSESRPLRLESLVARLLLYLPEERSRVIALSAVAAGMERTLARWVTGDEAATPARTMYRSTRQLIGRLQCKTGRSFDIRYDLLDRASLRFVETGEGGTPFIPSPFPPHPPAPSFEGTGPQKRFRPYLFWAAMHLVAPTKAGGLHAVLVSIPQGIGGYAQDLLDLIEKDWTGAALPDVFRSPTDPDKYQLWQRCLLSCADYFGVGSREYRLLSKGIVAHHGKMPGLMARLLIQLVDEGVVHLVLATSTLSEGVNLPFEVVLLPTLSRGRDSITPREFANLAGRAGRPGHGTEGRCLVLLPDNPRDWSERRAVEQYEALVRRIAVSSTPDAQPADGGKSALAALLISLFNQWQTATRSDDQVQFEKWLEVTTTVTQTPLPAPDALVETLDSLDGILLAAIVEIESLAAAPLSPADTERRLAGVWRRSYAHYASLHEALLGRWFLRRGQALTTTIYPDPTRRRRLYRSGLSPRLGDQLTRLYPSVRQHLLTGADHAQRDANGRFEYVRRLVELLSAHPKFKPATKTPTKSRWEDLLRWWLDPSGPVTPPGPTQVTEWYQYVATNFGYRSAWGIGCMLALAADEAHAGELRPTTLETWGEAGLPWIALWLKELIVWGTLDPVAAYLLSRSRAHTRAEASQLALSYYTLVQPLPPDDQLNPTTIRNWSDGLPKIESVKARLRPQSPVTVRLEREFPSWAARQWRVLPAAKNDRIQWVDAAGFILASSPRPGSWSETFLAEGDFQLDVDGATVSFASYL